MVVVKVRETYDLKTVQNKMTVIAIHTPKPGILKRNYPGLLMQCRAYRPLHANVVISCASVLPLDPQGVGTETGDVAPEDVFNPILYKAMSNKGMSQLEARINDMGRTSSFNDTIGETADVDVDSAFMNGTNDDFNIYYGLLSNTHDWKHANPQAGLSMSKLRPLVYDVVANVGDFSTTNTSGGLPTAPGTPAQSDTAAVLPIQYAIGNAKEHPWLNCTSYNATATFPGFPNTDVPAPNYEAAVPYIPIVCGCICIPPSRLHSLYYRMVVEWSIEFSQIRPLSEITNFGGLANLGGAAHFLNYSYTSTKKAITGDEETILENDVCMASANVDINKVM